MTALVLSFGLSAPRPSPWLLPQEPWAPETSATGGMGTRVAVAGLNVLYSTNGVALFKSADGGHTWTSNLSNFFLTPLDIYPLSSNFLFLYSGDNGLLYSTNGAGNFSQVSGVLAGAKAAVFSEDYARSRLALLLSFDGKHYLYFNDTLNDVDNWHLADSIPEPEPNRLVSDAFIFWPIRIVTTYKEGILGQGRAKLYYNVDTAWHSFTDTTLGEIRDMAVVAVPNLPDTDICIMLATEKGLVVFGRDFPNDYKLFNLGPLSKVVPYRADSDTVYAYLAPLFASLFRKVRIIWKPNASGITLSVLDSVGMPEGVADAALKLDGSLVLGTYGLGMALSDTSLNVTEANDGFFAWNTAVPGGLWAMDSLAYAVDISGRLMKTSDGGTSWEILPLDPLAYGMAVAACPSNPQRVYVSALGVQGSSVKTLWRSDDGGQTWQLVGQDYITDPYVAIQMAVGWHNPDEVWALRVDYAENILPFFSQDGGGSWEQVSGIPADSFFWVATAPDGNAYWATDRGVWKGRPGSWERLPGLPGKAVCVFYNPGDSAIYALSTASLFRLEGDTLRPIQSFAPAQPVAAAGSRLGDLAVLLYTSNAGIVVYSPDLGQTWQVDTPFVIPTGIGILNYGKVLVTTAGQGIRHGPWERQEPQLKVSVEPDSVEVGDTSFVTVEANVPLEEVACTLYLPQDTLPVSLEAQDAFNYKGEVHTAGLHGGHGVVRVVGVAATGDTLVGEDSLLVTAPTSGEIIVADSVYPWPNPAGDELNFHLYSELGARVTVVLFNIEGRPVATASRELAPKESADLSVDISRVSSGLYVWKVVARNGDDVKTLKGKLAVRK